MTKLYETKLVEVEGLVGRRCFNTLKSTTLTRGSEHRKLFTLSHPAQATHKTLQAEAEAASINASNRAYCKQYKVYGVDVWADRK